MTILSDNKIGFTHKSTQGYKAIVTDTKGQVIHQRTLDEVGGYEINSSSYIFDGISRYVYIGNATRDGNFYFISFALDTNFQNIELIDTVQLENNTKLFFDLIKFNAFKSEWEGFGIVQQYPSGEITDNCYISLDENYHFTKCEKLKGVYYPSQVLEFNWIESLNRYYLCLFISVSVLVDEEFNVVHNAGITFVYEYNNSTHITGLAMYNCLEPIGSTIFCYGKESFDYPYNAAFITLDLQGDSVHVVEAIPLSDPPLGMSVHPKMCVDLDGNYVVSSVNGLGPPNPNKIRLAKFSSTTYQKIWDFTYERDMTFLIWDTEIDQNNDIILVGQSWNIFGDSQQRGFLMKVYAHGSLSSYFEVPDDPGDQYSVQISPNPTASMLCLQAAKQPQSVRLWDFSGRLILEEKVGLADIVEPYCINLPSTVMPGFYAIEVYFSDGKRVIRKVVVGR
ncbi:MAG: hypothetical protein Q7T20_11890 [Saprospiraceae bacterium]|nr:hypothetical protein [Saprospiraceae bacterium]